METESLCCLKGNVKLHAFPQLQPFLQHLNEGTNSDGKHFLGNIRKYNCAFQMTSFGCNEIAMAGFNPSFRIQGQVYHLIGCIAPSTGESPKFCIFDNFKAQCTDKILQLLEDLNIDTVFVPTNCSGELQPLDLSVNKPVKDFL